MTKRAYKKSPQYTAFSAYMDGPFSELPKDDMGRGDPRRMCFIDDMGVPEELIFMLWQASRRAALEEAAKVCDELADGWNQTAQGATDGRYDFMAEAGDRCADEIRALSSGETET